MPIIRVSLIEGFASAAQKAEITTGMTEALVDVMGEVARPFVYVTVDDMKHGATSVGGTILSEEMMRGGIVGTERERAVRLTEQRVADAYEALESGDAERIAEFWDPAVTWSVPGFHTLSGTHKGIEELLAHVARRRELTGGSFRSERERILVGRDTSTEVRRESAARDDESHRALAADTVHVLTWEQGKVVAGREAYLGDPAGDAEAFWA
ncbi:nuclear transport factor 2 family protein [Streptomyces sp. NPDC058955]|uniref:nuclear transport factor 2 family protein n=1 Tax=unclassified Streptomyces TaxID=2593676 RepID=UPI00364EB1DE